ncbi:hypothetical protein O3G_MSEX008671 [Manduca sexta]|uniref:Uncharacterized protein n=1 Tax=Manduca sexta TaxID=7130 RepID=A0A921ZBD5_MANSE|nr:hypothetical protein O3G_MSEX008671 [Manduca sexta]
MKLLLIVMAAFGGVLSITYDSDVFDKLDIQRIVESNVKRREAFNCLMDRGPCEKYQHIKEKCPEMVKTDCVKCSPSQKVKYQELMKKLELEHNAEYREIIAKFRS